MGKENEKEKERVDRHFASLEVTDLSAYRRYAPGEYEPTHIDLEKNQEIGIFEANTPINAEALIKNKKKKEDWGTRHKTVRVVQLKFETNVLAIDSQGSLQPSPLDLEPGESAVFTPYSPIDPLFPESIVRQALPDIPHSQIHHLQEPRLKRKEEPQLELVTSESLAPAEPPDSPPQNAVECLVT